MALWGKNDNATDAPKFRVTDKFESGRTLSGAANAYGNVAISNGQVTTVVGADTTETGVTDGVTHAGWLVIRQGTGPVTEITGSGGTGYTNTDVLTISNGTSNATATIVTDGAGVVTGLTMTAAGAGFINTSAIAIGATGIGTGATFDVTLGGRAGRKHMETLVAMGSITGDGADDALLPDS